MSDENKKKATPIDASNKRPVFFVSKIEFNSENYANIELKSNNAHEISHYVSFGKEGFYLIPCEEHDGLIKSYNDIVDFYNSMLKKIKISDITEDIKVVSDSTASSSSVLGNVDFTDFAKFSKFFEIDDPVYNPESLVSEIKKEVKKDCGDIIEEF